MGETNHPLPTSNSSSPDELPALQHHKWTRSKYPGSLIFNTTTFLLPALHATLSKLWTANIDTSLVATTDAYTYMLTATEAFTEALPRAAWLIIGDHASRPLGRRLQLTHTLIAFQAFLGLLLSVAFVAAAPTFAGRFVPEVQDVSLRYVRIVAFGVLGGMVEGAVAAATRALDKPDVPLVINSVKFAVNIVLDLLLISRFHIGPFEPTVNIQGTIHLVCSLTAAFAGLGYFLWANTLPYRRRHREGSLIPDLRALSILLSPGVVFFAESAIRNSLYLWLVTTIVALGSKYATAWGVFNTIRWGLVMVPVQALEATSLQFISHKWGEWRQYTGVVNRRPKASWKQVQDIVSPARKSLLIALIVEVPIAIFLSMFGARPLARYLSGSDEVAEVTAYMWRTIDWCYIFYAMATQLASVLLATRPRWYLYQSLLTNLLYILPWAIVCQYTELEEENAWSYHSFVFGGSIIFSFVSVLVVDIIWAWTLVSGKIKLEVIRS